MIRWRFFLGDMLICLPLAVVLAGGWWLSVRTLPDLTAREAKRVKAEYRALAAAVKDGERPDVREEEAKGLSAWGQMQRGAWGAEPRDGRRFVWFRSRGANRVRGVWVDEIVPFDYARFFCWTGGAILLSVLFLTNVGLRYFRRFTRERDDFLAAAAHDLTTPLVGMRMMIGRDDEEAKRLNERMLLIVANIKDFLKLGGKRRKPESKPVDIVALCHEAYALFAADYEDSEGGAVEFHASPSDLSVRADETMLLQVLWNLFGNDLKYAAPYGRVSVRFFIAKGTVSVLFADEGPGMTPRQMHHAFDRYYRAKTVLESGKGGFGIGLCTAREFARAMGGDLTVGPNAPQGCIFTLSLPAA